MEFWFFTAVAMFNLQSQMANGTSRHWAMVRANSVFPEPVEPNIIMLDFSSLGNKSTGNYFKMGVMGSDSSKVYRAQGRTSGCALFLLVCTVQLA